MTFFALLMLFPIVQSTTTSTSTTPGSSACSDRDKKLISFCYNRYFQHVFNLAGNVYTPIPDPGTMENQLGNSFAMGNLCNWENDLDICLDTIHRSCLTVPVFAKALKLNESSARRYLMAHEKVLAQCKMPQYDQDALKLCSQDNNYLNAWNVCNQLALNCSEIAQSTECLLNALRQCPIQTSGIFQLACVIMDSAWKTLLQTNSHNTSSLICTNKICDTPFTMPSTTISTATSSNSTSSSTTTTSPRPTRTAPYGSGNARISDSSALIYVFTVILLEVVGLR